MSLTPDFANAESSSSQNPAAGIATQRYESGPSAPVRLPSPDTVGWRILMAAGPIFAAKGFRDATVREICDAAAVNIASVNYYFGDKKQLYHDTVLLAREMRVAEFPDPADDHAGPPEQRLEQLIALILHRLMVNQRGPWQVQLLMNEIQHPTEACQYLARAYFRPFLKRLHDLIEILVGRPVPEPQRDQLTMSIIGQCLIYRFAPETRAFTMGVSTDAIPTDPTDELQRLTEHITQFSIGGIRQLRDHCPAS